MSTRFSTFDGFIFQIFLATSPIFVFCHGVRERKEKHRSRPGVMLKERIHLYLFKDSRQYRGPESRIIGDVSWPRWNALSISCFTWEPVFESNNSIVPFFPFSLSFLQEMHVSAPVWSDAGIHCLLDLPQLLWQMSCSNNNNIVYIICKSRSHISKSVLGVGL